VAGVVVILLAGLVVAGVPPAVAAMTRYEAEQAAIFHGTVDRNHPGFTGTGFVNCANEVGSYVQWALPAAAGRVTLTFRYANGASRERPTAIWVNGTVVVTPSFQPTGAWSTWRTQIVTATLGTGANTVRATATTSNGPPNLDSLTVGDAQGATDWSEAIVESTMARYTPATLGGWDYTRGLLLHGQHLVYQRIRDPRYLSYIKRWADRFVDSSGTLSVHVDSLDSMLPGRVLLLLYRETGQARYRIAAQTIRDRLKTYPRTSDGGFQHNVGRTGQLWADGMFMSMPFLAEYGRDVGDSAYAFDEATRQLIIYGSRLQPPSGLLRHAYDERRSASWADPATGLSPEGWCRAMGWFGMAAVQVLDIIPADHPRRGAVITMAQDLVRGLAAYQDPATGRWFQVVNKGDRSDNWTETSCSAMATYLIDRAVEAGYVPASYQAYADRGYQGVLKRISFGVDGLTRLTVISGSTSPGSYSLYVARPRLTNDFRGLGAFLIMDEQLRT
jgi:unsaturated rhamnogalacturonyl hydrolase